MADIFNMADTWNNGATVFSAIKMDVTDTASDAASLLMDLLVGGASKFKVDKAGSVTLGGGLTVEASSLLRMGGATASYPAFKRSSTTIQARLADDSALAALAARSIALGSVADAVPVAATQTLSAANAQSVLDLAATWNTSGTPAAIKLDVTDTASNAASLLADLRVGGSTKLSVGKGGKLSIPAAANENAVALTQSLSGSNAQSILDMAATWNTSGTPTALKVNVTDTASNAASLFLDFQVGGSSKFAVAKTGRLTLPAIASASPALVFSGALTSGLSGFVAGRIDTVISSVPKFSVASTQARLGSDVLLGWTSTADVGGAIPDTILLRDAANTLAQRNGTSAQTYNQYFSYTDASNYTRMAFKTATGVHTIETESAGTGEANIDLALTPKGTGRVRFGTHSAIAAETVTGYITIKDAGGTSRKIAVVS